MQGRHACMHATKQSKYPHCHNRQHNRSCHRDRAGTTDAPTKSSKGKQIKDNEQVQVTMRSAILSSSTHSTGGAVSTSSCRGGGGAGGGQPQPPIKRSSSRGSLSSLGSRGSRRSRRSNSSRRLSMDSSESSIESALPPDEGAAAAATSRKSSSSSGSSSCKSSNSGSSSSSGGVNNNSNHKNSSNFNLYLGAGSCHRYNPSSIKKNRLDAFLASTDTSNKKKTPTSLTSHKSKAHNGMDNSDHSLGNISVESSLHASQEFSLENSLTWLASSDVEDEDGADSCDGEEFAFDDDVEDDVNEDSFYGDDTVVELKFGEDDESSSSSEEEEEADFEVSLGHSKRTKGAGRTNNRKKRQEKQEGKVELVISNSARRSLTSYATSRQEQHQQKRRQNAVPFTVPKGSIDTSARRSRKGAMDDSTHSMLSVLSLDKIEENRSHKDGSGSSSSSSSDEEESLSNDEQDDLHPQKVEDTVETLDETDDEDDGDNVRNQGRQSRSISNHSTISGGSWSEYSMGSFGDMSFLEDEFDDEEDEEVSLAPDDLDQKPRARGSSSEPSQQDSMTSSRREIMNLLSRENSISRMSSTTGGRRVVRTCPKEERDNLEALNNSNSSLGSDYVEPHECVGRAA